MNLNKYPIKYAFPYGICISSHQIPFNPMCLLSVVQDTNKSNNRNFPQHNVITYTNSLLNLAIYQQLFYIAKT
jgi:hypothetical protein